MALYAVEKNRTEQRIEFALSPAVAGLLECARVLTSLFGEEAIDRKAMR